MTSSGRGGRPSRRAVFEQFAAAVAELESLGGLPAFDDTADLWHDLWHMEVHHSTAVEGNTLVLREVEQLLDEGRAVGAKELKDYMEVLGYAEASRWVFEQSGNVRTRQGDRLVTLTELRQLHHVAMTRVWEVAPHPAAEPSEAPGSFRRHEIAAFPRGMKPPTFPVVPAMVDTWLDDVNTFGEDVTTGRLALVDAPGRLAQIHVELERIHPFLDGNGRTGRLVLNLVICRLGWAPVVILKSQRQRYLNALMRADSGDRSALAEIIARTSVASLHRLLPRLSDTTDLVPLRTLADERISLDALRRAVARSRLDATMDAHGTWRSTRAAVEEYLTTRHRRA